MDDIKKLTQRLNKDLNSLVNILELQMGKIDESEVPQIIQARADMEEVKRCVRKGDTEGINKIIDKYGGNNR
jgi:hypothetical protein